MTKQWPENNSPANFSDIVGPISTAIEWAYNLERQNKNDDIPYFGLPLAITGSSEFGLEIEQRMSKKYIDSVIESQHKTTLDILIECAVHLGIEQGRRLEKQENVNP